MWSQAPLKPLVMSTSISLTLTHLQLADLHEHFFHLNLLLETFHDTLMITISSS